MGSDVGKREQIVHGSPGKHNRGGMMPVAAKAAAARPRTEPPALGAAGDAQALAYLRKQGLVLVERTVGRMDLIMRAGAPRSVSCSVCK